VGDITVGDVILRNNGRLSYDSPARKVTAYGSWSNGVANAAPGSGYTRVPGADGVSGGLQDFNSFEEGEYDLNVGASGAKTVDYTVGTAQWATAAAAFKPSGGGGGSTLWAQSLM
jgi:hypothetical protein